MSEPIVGEETIITRPVVRQLLAVLRILVGFVMLWAFLDKMFGLGYSTTSEKAVINHPKVGPAAGFLLHGVDDSVPGAGFFHALGNSPISDVLFLLALLGIGVAAILGIGIRVTAVCATILLAMMWWATWPLGPGSENPIIDTHVLMAFVFILVAAASGGDTWGLGKWWKSLPFVKAARWLI